MRILNYALLTSFVAWFVLSAITVAPSEQQSDSVLCLLCFVIFASLLLVRTVILFRRKKSLYEIFFWPVCILAFVLGVLMVESGGCRVPKEELAAREMFRVEEAIHEHYVTKGEVPDMLSDVRDFEGGVSLTNIYGNPIEYSVSNCYYVTLRAYGFGSEHSRVKNYFILQFDVRDE